MLFRSLAYLIGLNAILSQCQLHAEVGADHAENMTNGLKLFRSEIGQGLKKHCVKCHGGNKTRGEFDLTTREGLLKGGSDGVAVIPGKSEASRLIKLISHIKKPFMPVKHKKLSFAFIKKIVQSLACKK